ncbi:MAG: glycine--tRNA ligase [Candidatus Thermoplasmatota archaeon]|nr:glycine--tRNA ligase [Candidatus Thermoplasmatota archaeon]
MTRIDPDGKKRRISDLYALLKRRGFFWPSYEIYGKIAGFFDLGPLGSLLRENIEKAWKDRFVIREGFLLVDCPSITPEVAFKWSGHLEKFTDLLTTCGNCGSPFRADHLLEGMVENPDAMTREKLESSLNELDVRCPVCGGKLGGLEEFNLMFKTHVGTGGERPAYLRPETAQSIFMNFSLLYRMNRERMPFGVAQIGKGFRNEISPRQGMLRQREFHMAEGEFFFDPEENGFLPFERTRDMEVTLLPRSSPDEEVVTSLQKAIDDGLICSKVLAHYMAVTQAFAADIGIPEDRMRFRQHLDLEMAHYARDCWDLEVSTSYGWVEMVGIADRSAYDLEQHSKGSGQKLTARRRFEEPRIITRTIVEADLKVLGPIFRGAAREAADALSTLDPEDVRRSIDRKEAINVDISSGTVEVPFEAATVKEIKETMTGVDYIPHVVEPSFGIDRLMIAVLEHAYFEAEKSPMKTDAEEENGPYRVMRLRPDIAPVKCGVFPLMNKDGLTEIAKDIDTALKRCGLTTFFDHSGSIGRRYARMDEIGTPYSITVDYDTKKDDTVTLRARDTGEQIRLPMEGIDIIVSDLLSGRIARDSLGTPI